MPTSLVSGTCQPGTFLQPAGFNCVSCCHARLRPAPVIALPTPCLTPLPQKSSSIKSNFLTEAVIGSLPRGLSSTEREFIVANTPLSPSLNLLSSLPRDQVSARSVEGRTLRRNVLRGAVVVFITAGYSGGCNGRDWRPVVS